MHLETKPLVWKGPFAPNGVVCSEHFIAQTPFGSFVVVDDEDEDDFALLEAPWSDAFMVNEDLENLKADVALEYKRRLLECVEISYGPKETQSE